MGVGFSGSQLYESVYSSRRMTAVFSETRQLQAWLDVEAALARAEATCGIVPRAAATEITAKARAERIELSEFRAMAEETVHPIVPLVRLLARECEDGHGRYVHWGATTQDIMDTGLVLQLREAAQLVLDDLDAVIGAADRLAGEHETTLMAGRTHAQHAVPITFGYKAAVWVDELGRARDRLREAKDGVSYVQFGGAAGTIASLGAVGIEVRAALADELALGEPAITWHVARDRLTAFAFALVCVAGGLRRIAAEVIELMRPEIGEVEEPFHPGKVGSSTMPHKRNPVFAETVWTLGELANETFQGMLAALAQRHERSMEVWQIEWDVLPRLCIHVHRMTELGAHIVGGLRVSAERMRSNLDLTGGSIYSEAMMMALATSIGIREAHDLVYAVAMDAAEQGRGFREVVEQDPRIREALDDEELAAVFSGERLIEAAVGMVRTVRAER